MVGRQRIDRVRREYNQWAANQTLEDFALRFTAKRARRWSAGKVGQTALGAVSFLALEAIGGSITLSYGFVNATLAIAATTVIIFATALPICIHAAKAGVDIDLLTRGAGFGYIGSTITSLIYASFTFIFFAIESAILAMALNLCLGIPLSVGYLLSAVVVIPLVVYGISAISRLQIWTQPFFIALNVLPIATVIIRDPQALREWSEFAGSQNAAGSFAWASFGAAASVTIALIVQVGEQVDYLRFLPESRDRPIAWWTALLSSGPGWIFVGLLKLLAGSFLAVFLIGKGFSHETAADPSRMYEGAFSELVGPGPLSLALTCVLVVVCQLKINVTNAYAGSIAWSNFFSRLTHHHPGRVVWLVFNVLVALMVMELGVYRALEETLASYSIVATAWVGALVADLVVNKPLGFSPRGIEFKRAHLYDINPVGVGSMAIAILAAASAQYGLFGGLARALSPFIALAVALVCAPLIAVATGGRFYIARKPSAARTSADTEVCCICEHAFEHEDMAHCPAYDGAICSLCCSLDARCHDRCKPHARLHEQLAAGFARMLPPRLQHIARPQSVEFVLTFAFFGGVVALILVLVDLQLGADNGVDQALLASALRKIFLSLLIVVGVASWWFHLNRLSRRAAQDESLRQTDLLMNEIDAHERTDTALKKAKEAAEAANIAKSRYVVGLSHELRTPLNAIMGYAQLLERDDALPTKPRQQVSVVRRNAHHLAGLIDGLLDISKIEAGKLDLFRDEVSIHSLLGQIADMFAFQAAAKGIAFNVSLSPNLPDVVAVDQKRLRQILINLLSNAIKFTREGGVKLTVLYRNQVAEFLVTDTGCGIARDDCERIFEPFERLSEKHTEAGTGLGLTICRLLAGVMGGDLALSSELGVGSTFKLKIFLPRLNDAKAVPAGTLRNRILNGDGRRILVVDDNPAHRELIVCALGPAGFDVHGAPTAEAGLALAHELSPALFILDIELPGANGWRLAEQLRDQGHVGAPVVMLSASAIEEHRSSIALPYHDAFLMKPIDLDHLIETVSALLILDPGSERATDRPPGFGTDLDAGALPDKGQLNDLFDLCGLGFIRGLREALREIAKDDRKRVFVDWMNGYLETVDLRGFRKALESVGKLVS